MIELYAAPTPNSVKICIMLEEVQLPYKIFKLDFTKGEHYQPEFLKINPNAKAPAIVDRDNLLNVFESGAILLYLAEKSGKLLPKSSESRAEVYQWLFLEASGFGPTAAQIFHFGQLAPEKIPYAIERYQQEALRLLAVIDQQLTHRDYLAGEYSIADIATFPIVQGFAYAGLPIGDFANVDRWCAQLQQRSAVGRGSYVLFQEPAVV
ncbi:MAG: glutathione S-transferase N-terminal domain-containing protein [Aphanocapsa lilacina HA4352-LM1]|jgi:GST-like protein|nr:glutathione S-transferase N-terminal domain-containing protein [Aphanocapsa lilacina HA4352-LM1]